MNASALLACGYDLSNTIAEHDEDSCRHAATHGYCGWPGHSPASAGEPTQSVPTPYSSPG